MVNFVDNARLEDALKTFNNVTKLKVTVYSTSQEVIMEYPIKNAKLCDYLHTSEYCEKLCKKSNFEGFIEIRKRIQNKNFEPYIYTCNYGLVEAIVPLEKNNEIIGYVMFGQITTDESKETIFEQIEKFSHIINYSQASKYIPRIPYQNEDLIKAEAKLLEICSKYFILDSIVKKGSEDTITIACSYIKENAINGFSIDSLCEYLQISRSKLYSLFKEKLNIGIAEYVRDIKLEESKKLLIESSHSINTIASMCDFLSSNAYIKIFKKKYGLTPLEFRRKNQ